MDRVTATIPPGVSAGDYAAALDSVKGDPETRRMHEEALVIRDRIDDLDHLLKLPRNERLRNVPERYYDDVTDYMQNEFYSQKNKAFITLLAGGFAATVAVVGAAAFGMLPPIAATALGTFTPAVSFGGGLAYLKALKRWILPRKGDKRLQSVLKNEVRQLEERKTIYENAEKNAAQNALKKALEAIGQKQPLPKVNEEEDFVDIAGVRLKVNPEPRRDCLKFLNEFLR